MISSFHTFYSLPYTLNNSGSFMPQDGREQAFRICSHTPDLRPHKGIKEVNSQRATKRLADKASAVESPPKAKALQLTKPLKFSGQTNAGKKGSPCPSKV